jgi:hypothetical protein
VLLRPPWNNQALVGKLTVVYGGTGVHYLYTSRVYSATIRYVQRYWGTHGENEGEYSTESSGPGFYINSSESQPKTILIDIFYQDHLNPSWWNEIPVNFLFNYDGTHWFDNAIVQAGGYIPTRWWDNENVHVEEGVFITGWTLYGQTDIYGPD